MTTITAETILRSRNTETGDVLSTLKLRYPRFIHAELMTHRAFSRNSASSRAIPAKKLIQDVIDNPVIPLHWGKNQAGMQAREELEGEDLEYAKEIWQAAMEDALHNAQILASCDAHKQIVNRILEPFAHITVLVSSTEWDNFLELRDHDDAEPHIQMLAKEVRKCIERTDDIQELQAGDWHLPFTQDLQPSVGLGNLIKVSTARCASVSYETVDGKPMTIDRAIALHDKLVGSRPLHASPCEHVAQADGSVSGFYNKRLWGNFQGFAQYRKYLEAGMDI